ncbi:MAG TPA: 5-formyltetrahydrofolate cyclo-ligase [Actinomycetota bacterium]|nr:5-formyltetrahydrofolate cyclo-ligase [Actinomycetota bacterium]
MSERLPDALAERKRDIRRSVLHERDALLEEDRRARSVAITERLMALPELRYTRTVMAFWSFGSEVDTSGLIEALHAAGKRVVLPRVDGREVAAVVYVPGDPTAAASFGAMEPTSAEIVRSTEIDVVIAPGVAFDRNGGRVGYGGGFYDRFLRTVRADTPVIGLAFAVQLVDEVPRGEHDRPVDVVVTEMGLIRRGA